MWFEAGRINDNEKNGISEKLKFDRGIDVGGLNIRYVDMQTRNAVRRGPSPKDSTNYMIEFWNVPLFVILQT